MSKKYDVAIIGGGVIGSSVAHFLAERGCEVAIVEKQRVASEASKAAAGLLGVQAEWDAYDPLFELARESRAIFPQLAKALREKTGIDIGYEEKGIYRIAQNEEEKTRIRNIMHWQQETGEESYYITGDELRQKEPFLSSSIIGAVYYPKDGHVIAPELTKALAQSAAISGADIYEQTEVFDIQIEKNRVSGIVTSEGFISCEKVVIAGGSWSTKLLQYFHRDWGTYPVKGEVVAVKSYKPLIRAPIFQERFYIAPKRGGRYVMGATMEPHTCNKSVQPKSITSILERAYSILPALKDAEWETAWAGLRPQSNHDVPYMGEHEEIKGLCACAGHYRNGILLSPISGQYMADIIEGKQNNHLLDSLLSKSV
ncbi:MULTISPECIES: glycine oxidase ThiO [unclassified Bacillus cereus group]|uniref:glycine oxidase ThiO n=1 Tax=unclassified Bacillus cereus group TaxID=2750818 RepID=UPI001F568905|nr:MULTISPECIES: glycine oxidase ThiO [unclassified Bacillus cereus group]